MHLVGPGFHVLLIQGGSTAVGEVPGSSESGDQFGAALSEGNFNGNSVDDLVIGPRVRTWAPSATPAR